ncbi:MAG: hypothetical protein COT34_02545 [Candidatus Nealsonbacteria bacterium CG08_land_8_20_14_0_20_43_11]|uniref:PAC domain-containing protein n=1 Tax=Candidatus Nealsonbacteria bacterium CG08_land_8_20_14_0_20_43_11 TaxID=1974706 RepID=A0A2M6T011_9BACT|nr:MAG: hypothetical protein COT34_02545 [Candidatus Nealsonbacteria bacterium CG08_land_8_20_14_0_20_43_11]
MRKEVVLAQENPRELEEDLADLQKYIEDLTMFLPLAFCAVNPFSIILGVNQAFQDLTGYEEMEAIGNEIDFLFLEQEKLLIFKKKVAAESKRITGEFTLLRKDSKQIPVSLSGLARRGEKGEFLGYFLIISDISETKKFQEELEKKVEERTEELQEKIKELETFNKSVVGRELRMVKLKERIRGKIKRARRKKIKEQGKALLFYLN